MGSPHDAPVIDPAFLCDEADLETTVAGVRKAQEILSQPVLARWRGAELTPGAMSTDGETLAEYVRSTGLSLFHPVSTCRMGADLRAVVDLEFQVVGTSGPRVVDASSMPSIVRAHTHAPVTMLAERAAEVILAG